MTVQYNFPPAVKPLTVDHVRILRDWTARLRSGEYQQTKGALTRVDPATGENAHCCLGVLCEIALESGVASREWNHSGITNSATYKGLETNDTNDVILPQGVADWAGLIDRRGLSSVDVDGLTLDLAFLNDDNGYTFDQIANVVDEWVSRQEHEEGYGFLLRTPEPKVSLIKRIFRR